MRANNKKLDLRAIHVMKLQFSIALVLILLVHDGLCVFRPFEVDSLFVVLSFSGGGGYFLFIYES